MSGGDWMRLFNKYGTVRYGRQVARGERYGEGGKEKDKETWPSRNGRVPPFHQSYAVAAWLARTRTRNAARNTEASRASTV